TSKIRKQAARAISFENRLKPNTGKGHPGKKELLMRAISILAILLGGNAALAHPHAKVVTQNEFKIGAKPTIVVDSAAGGVELEAGPAGIVKIEAERQAGSEDEARKLDVQTRLDGNTVHVVYKHAGSSMWNDNANVNFRISAPADAKLEIRTGGGAVAARGFSGGVRADTAGGGI